MREYANKKEASRICSPHLVLHASVCVLYWPYMANRHLSCKKYLNQQWQNWESWFPANLPIAKINDFICPSLFSFVGGNITLYNWREIPRCKFCAVKSKEVMRRMKKCMMSGWRKKSQEACLGRVMMTNSKAPRAHEPHLYSLLNTKQLFLEWPNQKQFLNIKIILLNSPRYNNLKSYIVIIWAKNITCPIFIKHVHSTRHY